MCDAMRGVRVAILLLTGLCLALPAQAVRGGIAQMTESTAA